MSVQPGVVKCASLDAEAVQRDAAAQGYVVFVLPKPIDSKRAFFDAVAYTLPLDPRLYPGGLSWDAMRDSLEGGLIASPDKRVAILWPDATKMAVSASSEFATAFEILEGAVSTLASPRWTAGNPKELAVIVELAEP